MDLLAKGEREGLIELRCDKNMSSLTKAYNSQSIVTRLYVEGEYGDDGYVGIDSVNPTGLPFLLNFDYFKEMGLFTDTHQEAMNQYLSDIRTVKREMSEKALAYQQKLSRLNDLWGQCDFIVYKIKSSANHAYTVDTLPLVSAGKSIVAVGDPAVVAYSNGTHDYAAVTSVIAGPDTTNVVTDNGTAAQYLLIYKTKASGLIGGKEVTVEAKEKMAARLEKQMDATTGEALKDSLREQIKALRDEVSVLLRGNDETPGIYALTREAILLAIDAKGIDNELARLNTRHAQIETAFANVMGDMLRDGYWSDDNYALGQEVNLYADALEMSREMGRPEVNYEIDFIDLSSLPDYKGEAVHLNMPLHLIDEELEVNEFAFVTKVTRYPDDPRKNTIEISNKEIDLTGRTFDSLFGRMEQIAQQINGKNALYERAGQISSEGKLSTDALSGMIDVQKTRLLSAMSNWHTDGQGNIIFVAQDQASAMMLTGAGFLIADGKDDTGEWNWRTFGTGKGFTADLISTGTLQAGLVKILGTDRFVWDADNIYIFTTHDANRQIRIGRYDGTNYGIAFTSDNGNTFTQVIDHNGVQFSTEGLATIAELKATEGRITARITNVEGDVSSISQTVTGIESRVSAAEGDLSSLSQTADSIKSQLTSHEGDIAELVQTADSLKSRIASAEGDVSTLHQTAASLQTQVSSNDNDISTLNQTASGISARVENTEGSISALTQTATGLTTAFAKIGTNGTQTGITKIDENGLTITHSSIGGKTTIAADGMKMYDASGRIIGGTYKDSNGKVISASGVLYNPAVNTDFKANVGSKTSSFGTAVAGIEMTNAGVSGGMVGANKVASGRVGLGMISNDNIAIEASNNRYPDALGAFRVRLDNGTTEIVASSNIHLYSYGTITFTYQDSVAGSKTYTLEQIIDMIPKG